jgi:hypothetical protein
MLKPVITILALVLAVGTASAQRRAGPGRAGAVQADRDALKKRIRAMRVWYLTEELALDDATAARLFPVLARYDDQLEALQVEGARLRRELRQGLAGRGNQAETARLVDALLAHYDKVYQLQRDRVIAARKVLSAAQAGRLLLVLPRVDNAIRRQIGRVMRGQAGLGKGERRRVRRGMSPDLEDPYTDDDDDMPPRKAPASATRQHPF